ncbi:PREDICTED: vacuolar protein sorting-associated protein 37B-like [Acropora digitifera]|uniref:vacuolar protein sorting-associated protein 37B-like n=1 Tax=Acropora digitifera TaxID=70779 RepID=UPI00077AB782|nr:PREDICTED: vacuolar protein sorting-associated protein 37B-like [Acropora digitifera]
MSGIYGSPSFVNGPQLNEAKALQEIMSLLQHIDKGELQELLNNEGQINNLISDNEEVKRIGIHQDTVMASNRSLAEYNLSQQPVLERKKQMLIEAYQNKTLIQVEFDKNQQKLETLSSQYSPDTTLALLQASAQQAEDEAEKTADKFMDGEINVDEFIQTFQSQKTTHHLRKIKSEKLSELLRSRRPSQYSYRY